MGITMKRKWLILGMVCLLGLAACGKEFAPEQGDNSAVEENVTGTAADNEATPTPEEEYPGRPKVDPAQITYADSYSFNKLTYAGLEEAEFSCLLEAEDAKTGDGVTLKKDKAGYS